MVERRLPDFCYEPNRTFTFDKAATMTICATNQWWKPAYKRTEHVVRPILRTIPSLAIKPAENQPKPKASPRKPKPKPLPVYQPEP